MLTLTPTQGKTWKSWLLVPIALVCLPADWISVLWFAYHLADEQRIVHSQMYDLLIFATYMVVAAFGIYLWGFALILWLVLVLSDARGRLKGIASVLLLLALLGTFKAGWVIGLRH